jgi:hypothetical protein
VLVEVTAGITEASIAGCDVQHRANTPVRLGIGKE